MRIKTRLPIFPGVLVVYLMSYQVSADIPSNLFDATRGALAIISAGHVTGSGFVAVMNAKRYLITNEHVLRGGQPFSATLLNGQTLKLGTLDVAEDRDVVRFELVATNVPALPLSTTPHSIGDAVGVFGNSEGGGVATSIFGKLVGLGPVLIETDAAFVRGNSGSPILDDKGEIVGVATFAVRDTDPNDWVKQGTRFAQVRRFGVRLNGTKWKTINAAQYFLRADALADLETFCLDLYNLRVTGQFIDANTRLFDYRYEEEKKRYRRCVGLCKLLADAVATFNPAIQRERSANYYAKESTSERVQKRIDAQRNASMNVMIANQRYQEHAAAYKKVYANASVFIQHNDWLAQRMKDDAAFWLEVLKIVTRKTED